MAVCACLPYEDGYNSDEEIRERERCARAPLLRMRSALGRGRAGSDYFAFLLLLSYGSGGQGTPELPRRLSNRPVCRLLPAHDSASPHTFAAPSRRSRDDNLSRPPPISTPSPKTHTWLTFDYCHHVEKSARPRHQQVLSPLRAWPPARQASRAVPLDGSAPS